MEEKANNEHEHSVSIYVINMKSNDANANVNMMKFVNAKEKIQIYSIK